MFPQIQNLLESLRAGDRGQGKWGDRLDWIQDVADLAGFFDQSGSVDLGNAMLSLLRSATASDPEQRTRHLKDAGMRGLGAIPFVGDLAKVGRTGRYMDEGQSFWRSLAKFRSGPAGDRGTRKWPGFRDMLGKIPSVPVGSVALTWVALQSRRQTPQPTVMQQLAGAGGDDLVTLYRGVQNKAINSEFSAPLSGREPPELVFLIKKMQSRKLSQPEKNRLKDLTSRHGNPEKWYTDSLEEAKKYAGKEGGIYEIQVPRAKLREYLDQRSSLSTGGTGSNYRIPFETHAKDAAKQLSDADRKAIKDLSEQYGIGPGHQIYGEALRQLGINPQQSLAEKKRPRLPGMPGESQRSPLLDVSAYFLKKDPQAAYFYGSTEHRKRMRTDITSPFFDAVEQADDLMRKHGFETRAARQRRFKRERAEDLHQRFLGDPDMDVKSFRGFVRRQKAEFSAEREQILERNRDAAAGEVKEKLKDFGKGLADLVTGKGLSGLIGGFTKLLGVVLTLPPALSKFGEALVESKRQIGYYNGGTAARLAGLDMQKFALDVRTAHRTSASTNAFLDEYREFRKAYQPMRETYSDLANIGSTIALRVGNIAAHIANGLQIVTGFKFAIDMLVGNKNPNKQEGDERTRGERMLHDMAVVHGMNNRGKRPPLGRL